MRRQLNDRDTPSHQQNFATINETYDRPKPFDNVVLMSQSTDRNNNHVLVPPERNDKIKIEDNAK